MRRFGSLRAWLLIASAWLCCAAILWAALQRPQRFHLAIGGELRARPDAPTVRDVYLFDAPYLTGFHAAEPATIDSSTSFTYRWTEPSATVHLPLLGGSAAVIDLQLLPPPLPATPLTLTLNAVQLHTILTPEPRTLHLFVPGRSSGQYAVTLTTPQFAAPDDPRALGLALVELQLSPSGWRPIWAWNTWGALAGIVALLALASASCGLAPAQASTTALLGAAALTLGLLIDRSAVVLGAGRWLTSTLAASLALLGWRAASRWSVLDAQLRRESLLVAGLMALAWVLRMAGIRHPQANYSDLLLNTHNFDAVAQGSLFFTEGLPAEAGGGQAPYPPGLYIVLLPLLGLMRNPSAHTTILQIGTALLDAAVVPLLWWGVRAVRHDAWGRAAALWAAALYLLPLPLLRSFIVGELANIGGQALALPGFIGAVVWVAHGCPQRWMLPLSLALAAGALGHSGVLISLGMTGALWALGLALQRRWAVLGRLCLVALPALTLAASVYYSAFINDPRLVGDASASASQLPFWRKTWLLLQATTLRRDADTPVWLWLAALGGWLVARRQLRRWSLPLAVWLLTAPLSFVSLLWSAQTVRWWTWVLPALCIGAGLGLAALSSRGRLGRRLAISAYMAYSSVALAWWVDFIITYRTGAFVP